MQKSASIQELLDNADGITTFAAGPTKLAREVKARIVEEIIEYENSGLGILEYSHRSQTFGKVLFDCEKILRDMLSVPEDYHILFLQGGATGQFASIPMNLFGSAKTNPPKADYLVTGTWSAKAVKEASKYGEIREICPRVENFKSLPSPDSFEFDPEAEYFFFCDNETVHGLEYTSDTMPQPPEGVPIVCDMSSNLLSRPVDIAKYDLIFAGAQKNMGSPGVTIVIIKSDLLGRSLSYCPGILEYKTQVANKSMYNTPPTFKPHVTDKAHRSRLNIIVSCANGELNAVWLKEASALGLLNLNGHRSIGGLRISMYNAITMEEVDKLVKFMVDFQVDKSISETHL